MCIAVAGYFRLTCLKKRSNALRLFYIFDLLITSGINPQDVSVTLFPKLFSKYICDPVFVAIFLMPHGRPILYHTFCSERRYSDSRYAICYTVQRVFFFKNDE